MPIRITVSDRVRVKVRGTLANDTGAADEIAFDFVAKRLTSDALKAAIADKDRGIEEFLAGIVSDWRRVLDDVGDEVPFSPEALDKLFSIPGVALLMFRAYLSEVGANPKT